MDNAQACNSSVIKRREKRAPNFTDQENRLLVNLVLLHDVVENKKTDAVIWKIKETTWAMIADKFNANSGTIYRAAGNLRKKYEQMKKILKKKVTKNKQETFKTGGGNPDYIKIEDWEKDLLLIIEKQINGLPSEFDSDSVLPQTDITGAELIVDATISNNYPSELVIDSEKQSTSNTIPVSTHFSDMEVECPSLVFDWQTRDSLEVNVVKETESTADIGNHMTKPEVKSKTQDTWSSWTPKQL